ncbi:MAG: helix-turn-helix transcriptional regulator [Lachnospiraceae bacterium]|nr:helix-turn-helix transcriptional regulator [Lachnospiraceae bacterium]
MADVLKNNRIADLRIKRDLTQQQIADVLHCQREVYRRYEKGIRELPLSYAIILADYYRVSLDYLVGRSQQNP